MDAGVPATFAAADLRIRSKIDYVIAVLAEETGCYVQAKDRDTETILSRAICSRRASGAFSAARGFAEVDFATSWA